VDGSSMVGKCILKGEAQIASSFKNGVTRFKNPLLPETRSELALPLISQGKTIGALTIQASQEDAFSKEDITTFQTLASLLASSITNARLFHQTQKALDEIQEVQRRYVKALFGK
jgi:GAF domain-containing protein